MRILVLATGNEHKVQEIAPLLAHLPFKVRTASSFGRFEPDETGSSLEENALIKAVAAMKLTGEWSISDDTGLEVDALDGRPGIYAARYAGEHCSFADNIKKLLCEMQGIPLERRTAKFISVIALCRPGHAPETFRGECPGRIAIAPRGIGGFGYDPIFEVAGPSKTFAELSTDEKNRLSHRSIAIRACAKRLEELA